MNGRTLKPHVFLMSKGQFRCRCGATPPDDFHSAQTHGEKIARDWHRQHVGAAPRSVVRVKGHALVSADRWHAGGVCYVICNCAEVFEASTLAEAIRAHREHKLALATLVSQRQTKDGK